jgi:hypothetical protein
VSYCSLFCFQFQCLPVIRSPAVVKHLRKRIELIYINLYLVSFILYIYYVFVCFLMLTSVAVFVLGCNWPYLAVVKHVNK